VTESTIIYTHTDEAPLLATYSLLPVVQAYAAQAGVAVVTRDISLAGRILASFPERLREDQRVADSLAELGRDVLTPEANIIKLPNVSASVPQLKAAVAELQVKGFDIPDFPEDPVSDEDHDVLARYRKVLGSAVNPVLRQGNSDRRAPASVKHYAQTHPHRMGVWSPESATNVAHMHGGDFYSNERSAVMASDGSLQVHLVAPDGTTTELRAPITVLAGEVVDATVMQVAELRTFLDRQIARAKADGVLFSVHLKATMMKVSDPIIFGHALRAYFSELFTQHGAELAAAGVNPNDGLAALLGAIEALPPEHQEAIRAAIEAAYANGPDIAMVDSDRGITNLHVPSDVIVDASMPAAIRSSGQMWNARGEQQDTNFVIPDHAYAPLYAETIEHCREYGAFDPATMGSTANVGLMAQAAEEYGSHETTFEMTAPGTMRVRDAAGTTLLEHSVAAGDIWRMCRTTDAAVRDWVALAVARAGASGSPAIFWLDEQRPHDAQLLLKVRPALAELNTSGLTIEIMDVPGAARYTLARARAGEDTISVTGNILRDYLTDLFPILELGTSAKMLSIVRLLSGGALLETGAGGSAPRHMRQFVAENHLRWDSLGEFLALGPSLELLAEATENPRAKVLAVALDSATGRVLEENRSPSRRTGQLDTRGSHFYLALYWAQQLAAQTEDAELAELFAGLAQRLAEDEPAIVAELIAVQGSPVDIGGYYRPDPQLIEAAMRPSQTFNAALAEV